MTNCEKLKDHIIEHEIIGFECECSGITPPLDLSIYDDEVSVASGVQHINFKDELAAEFNALTGYVDISLGNLNVESDRLWVYDSIRGKWLSADRLTASAGRRGRSKNAYLRLFDAQTSNLTGYRLPRKATMTAIVAQTRGNETWTLRVRKNGSPVDIASLAINNVAGGHDTTIDVDLDEGDQVQFFTETTSFFGIKDPFIWIEIAWRNDNL